MLKYRTMTAFVLLLIIIGMIWLLPAPWFAALAVIFFAVGAWEWSRLVGLHAFYKRCLYFALVLSVIFLAYLIPPDGLLWLGVLVWLWAGASVLSYQRGLNALGFQYPFVKGFCGLWMLAACWKALVILQAASPVWLFLAFVVIWAVDTGAYFSGRRWGHGLLAPRISPQKTWQGFWGGLCFGVLIVSALMLWFPMVWQQRLGWVVVAIICALFAVMGDLFVSLLKRQVGVKDTGSLLPGHGGFLDRVDSTISTLPVFALGFLWLGS